MDKELQELLEKVRTGKTTPDDAKTLERHLTTDSMVPELRNKLAYKHHIFNHANAGIHVHADLNDFGLINKRYGDHVGDEAITKYGKTAAAIAKKWGGRAFRSGGDETKFWFLEPHHAENFARELKHSLTLSGSLIGDHRVSASIGIGHSMERAEAALMQAKKQIKEHHPSGQVVRHHPEGQSPTVIVSALSHGSPPGWKTAVDSIREVQNANGGTTEPGPNGSGGQK